MIGINFQPGAGMSNGTRPKPEPEGVQEAIRVLSLRLPKVVGAQGLSPQMLLSSEGAGGNPRVDSVVNQVLSRMFPTKGAAPSHAPSFGTAPSFVGGEASASSIGGPSFGAASYTDTPMPIYGRPRIIADVPRPPEAPLTGGPVPKWPGLPGIDGGGGQPPGLIGTLPPNFTAPSPVPEYDVPWAQDPIQMIR